MPFRLLFVIILLLSTKKTFCQDNYHYDFLGRLSHDYREGITQIIWNNKNQVTHIMRADTCHSPDLEFSYDVNGNRIMKLIKPRNGHGLEPESSWKYTYYSYDPKGNCIAIYERNYSDLGQSYKETYRHAEQNLFTDIRIGTEEIQQTQLTHAFNAVLNEKGEFENIGNSAYIGPSITANKNAIRGDKMYEMNNHLNNTVVVVSDQKEDGHAALQSASDYYPFGMTLADKKFEQQQYRYGMNGQERTFELAANHYTARYWEYDSRLGRRWNIDPVVVPAIAPYATFENNPVRFSDKLGDRITGDLDLYYSTKMAVYDNLIKNYQRIIKTDTKDEEGWMYAVNVLMDNQKRIAIALQELKVLEESDQEYHIGYTMDDEIGVGGLTRFNKKTNAIDVLLVKDKHGKLIGSEDGAEAMMIHELKHAHQFEEGEITFGHDSGNAIVSKNFHDPYDEIEAYARMIILGKFPDESGTDEYYKSVPRNNLNSIWEKNSFNVTQKEAYSYITYVLGMKNQRPHYIFKGWEKYYNAGKNNEPIPLSEDVLQRIEKLIEFNNSQAK